MRRPITNIAIWMMTFLIAFTPHVVASRDLILDVNGQNIHVQTIGEVGPTVVFEAGLGNGSDTWSLVAPAIATFARAVLYDRAGLGQSLPLVDKSSVVTADQVATSLHVVLTAADIRPPYILVGHSLGGLYVQMFARKYLDEVSGLVLLDSSSADAPSTLKTRAHLEPGTAAYLEEKGIPESNKQARNSDAFPDVPLTVVAATDHGPFFKEWEPTLLRLQQQLATLSPQASLIVAKGSGHDVQIDRPEIVIDAVRRVALARVSQ